MPATVILGGHWGDEGKGKVIDLLAPDFEYNVRYSGGANAGHTVVNEHGSFALHQVPSGVLHGGLTAMLAAGTVVDPRALLAEMDELRQRGVSFDRFYISERAHLVLPYHYALDVAMEQYRAGARIGTTGKGIGPAYADKASRDGLRVGDLLDKSRFVHLLEGAVASANRRLASYGAEPVDRSSLVEESLEWAEHLRPYICDVERDLRRAHAAGRSILLEGAQGALLDLDSGSYPFVTSSSTGAAGACVSAGLPPSAVTKVISVMHAYMTRVGAGPFPTEANDAAGEHIRTKGNEFGTTTGRARRCGWFDAVASRYAVEVNGVSSLALTKLDVLDGLETVKLCVGYEVKGKRLESPPPSVHVLGQAQPVYEEVAGWETPTAGAGSWEELPKQAQAYVRRIEELMGVPAGIISVGPARSQTIVLSDVLG